MTPRPRALAQPVDCELYKSLLDSLPDTMIVLFDRELRTRLVHGSLLERPSLGAAVRPGRPAAAMFDAAQRDAVLAALAAALDGRSSQLRYVGPDARVYHVDISPYYACARTIDGVYTAWRDVTDAQAPAQRSQTLAAIVERSEDAIYAKDRAGTITAWTGAAERLYGYAAREAIGQPVSMLVPVERAGEHDRLLTRALAGQPTAGLVTVRRHRDGHRVDVSISVAPLYDTAGVPIGASIVARDITDQLRAEQECRRLATIVHNSHDAIIATGLDGVITHWNAAAERMYRYTAEQAIGRPFAMLLPPDLRAQRDQHLHQVHAGEAIAPFDTRRVAADGVEVDVSVTISAIRDGAGRVVGFSSIARDISERKRHEAALRHLADHDALTGLHNRRHFGEELARTLASARRHGREGSLLVLDLDGFKAVNDTLGHARGDELLSRIADVLRANLRASDLAARLGGDEFAAILPDTDAAQARLVADKLLVEIAGAAVVGEGYHRLAVTASIGIAGFGARAARGQIEVTAAADAAMYAAKLAGKNQIVIDGESSVRASAA